MIVREVCPHRGDRQQSETAIEKADVSPTGQRHRLL